MKDQIKRVALQAVENLPKGHLSDLMVRETIRCALFGFLQEQGYRPVPAFRNPRYPEGPVDLVGMAADQSIEVAICSNPTIELKNIKSLDRVLCENKFVISYSPIKKKVEMSTFFLKPGIEHIYLYDSS